MTSRRKKKPAPPFVQLRLALLDCPAWRALTAQERTVYVHLAKRYNGSNNGWLAFSVRDAAEECSISKNTAARAFLRLEELGFVDCVTPGGFSRKTPHAAEWRLTAYPCNRALLPGSMRFMKWGRGKQSGPTPEAPTHGVDVYVSQTGDSSQAQKAA